ncbi:polyprenyl synthetase family protein [Streptomyces sp. NPDC097640]|uniref:polyprenyl synthetase family protein n=1 Tax=Streptomyces sp. NPDC097640 TaxID=3157229 RepID=UPI0033203894
MTLPGPMGLSMRDRAVEADVRAGLAAVEAGLLEATKSDVPFITEAAQHLVRAGAKRLRPLLVLLAARFGDPDAPGVVPSAVVVELTHLATLYHDDVLDDTDAHHRTDDSDTNWDNSVAVLTGDFLFARASHLLADLGPEAVRIQSDAFRQLVTGQILETAGPSGDRDPIEHYLEVLAGRAGSLIAVSGRLGALASGAGREVAGALAHYGERLGVACRLAEDVLDIAEGRGTGGLPRGRAGTALREGFATLPVLYLRARAKATGSPEDRELCELLAAGFPDEPRYAEALGRLRAHPALEQARVAAARYADEARAALAPLPAGAARRALEDLCEVVTRGRPAVSPAAPAPLVTAEQGLPEAAQP